MAESAPMHRRWWRLWMEPSFALEEWRELKALAEDLRVESEHLADLRKGMQGGLRSNPLGRYAQTLRRMSERWGKRAEIAKRDAIGEARGDSDWVDAREAAIHEDLAVSYLAGAVAELRLAEQWLDRDPETKEQVQALREALTAVTMDVNGRDPGRRLPAESDY